MLKDKLNRLSDQIVREKKDTPTNQNENRYSRLSSVLNGQIEETNFGSFIKVVSDFDRFYAHGRMMIDELDLKSIFKRDYFYNCDEPKVLPSNKLLFFDMETTGLGGSGTVPFLIGFGSVTEDGFQVRQYFLPDFPDEEAMMYAVREEIKDDTIIVSYNGKAFDMPILIDRLIIHRVERDLNFADHIDLLNMARRMYRRRLRECTLSNIEDKILDYHRVDDIPGYLVPSIYFNWLNYDQTDELEGVVEHNLNDIISLFFLMHHFAEIRERPEEKISEPDDILSLAKIYDSRREPEKVISLLESFDDIARAHDRFDLMLVRSFSYKRSGRWDEAVALWETICSGKNREALIARVELAKYFEHRARDFETAIIHTSAAGELIDNLDWPIDDIQKRINRLKSKISRYTS